MKLKYTFRVPTSNNAILQEAVSVCTLVSPGSGHGASRAGGWVGGWVGACKEMQMLCAQRVKLYSGKTGHLSFSACSIKSLTPALNSKPCLWRTVYALTLKNKLGFFERLRFREIKGRFRGLGFRGLGFRGLGFRGLGFRVLGLGLW